ncbi:cobaltochelatase subunit CobN [Actinobacteria bacterium YIM 96077]|uniref:Cobaltochelatase subunit CobN n=1 Tax=Phytoactinopolyspora halophila TaxID=1981511 RepID=A0A329QPM4_9ACTN|nr:cobaltochelatase subunit CobN [Phytoactinopolyspora halophila]AYY15041.1 cobaltochelatase subunit CobN [Actinobacteria bacterium YIM 96077]RAW14193.1 cobaltochelatase subunit CobN [Phytoactinopolyspora halophila]
MNQPPSHARLLLLSTADTDLLTAVRADDRWSVANPARTSTDDLPVLLENADVAVVRLLGGREAWPDGLDAVCASGVPTVVVSGESSPDAQLHAHSTVPTGVATETQRYLVAGGPANLAQLAAFLCDTILLTGEPFEPPAEQPRFGIHDGHAGTRAEDTATTEATGDQHRPVVGIVFYRSHELSGNTAFIDVLCEQIEAAGGVPRPIFTDSLRGIDRDEYAPLRELLGRADVVITTVLASGGLVGGKAVAGEDDDAWNTAVFERLGVTVIQGMTLTNTRDEWLASDGAMNPMDAATQIALPEFDGRIIAVPFSFKEISDVGVPHYVADPERARRLAGIAVRTGRLREVPNARKRVALVLSSYPTKHARVGNAVGLDTPASAVEVLRALRDAGYDIGDLDLDTLGRGEADDGGDALPGDALVHRLIAAGGHDVEWLTEEQLSNAVASVPLSTYASWFHTLPPGLRASMTETWGDPPGELYVDTSGDEPAIAIAGLRFGNVVVMIQPPRGFGENPVAIYHDPNLAPSHHYFAAYRWLQEPQSAGGFGADAVVHLGKHGTLEWLPGKGLGLSAECAPDPVLGDLPMVYPFIVNDPGEATQAKRRSHAVLVDHLIPPMARADTYGDLAKLEQLLDEYATVSELDPAKAPTVRTQIWELVTQAQLHHDLHTDEMPGEDEFDDFVLHVDGYLCEIKDVQIREGLHVLGQAPEGNELVNDVLAVLRARQVFGGETAHRGLRGAIAAWAGLDEQALLAEPGAAVEKTAGVSALLDVIQARQKQIDDASDSGSVSGDGATSSSIPAARTASDVVDLLESAARALVEELAAREWQSGEVERVVADVLGAEVDRTGEIADVMRFGAEQLVPRLARTTDEITNCLNALDNRYVPPGPSGSPTRGLVNVLPTGRNPYAVDPKAVPSRNAWDVGVSLGDSLLRRHKAETGAYPTSVGLTVWGTAAMRTQGDDIAEVLWLLGVRPLWDDASRRVTGFEVVPADELTLDGEPRPRVDVTVRISGFFRDAFPHVIGVIDDAVRTVAELDDDPTENHLRAHVTEDVDGGTDPRRATARIFGSKPGSYGAGLLPLVDARNWRTDADLAEVYAVWGGFAYGRGLDGVEARDDMEKAFSRIQVAVKNQDTREHDIVDSDDYYQYHGGMVAMVRHLSGSAPAAYVGDSAVPEHVRTRSLSEETSRVFRARVVNPKWISAMQRHGYKGAFEMAATVDYLFGYDATAGVVEDWMYETLTREYVNDPEVAEFFRQSNPWARKGIAERLLEASQRGLWSEPSDEALEALQQAILETEGDLED